MHEKLISSLKIEAPALRQVGIKLAKNPSNHEVAKLEGINLAQGLCLMPTPSLVKEAACAAIKNGKNFYTFAQGIIELRQAIAARLRQFNKIGDVTAENVLVTAGSTGAFESVCACFLEQGDEVISFRPFYPYHRNTLERCQVKTNYIQLKGPSWSFDESDLEEAVTPRTKFVLLTSPNNPTGKVFSRKELELIADFCCKKNLLCVTDEVYEYMTYDGVEHTSIASLPGMFDRTITMSSYSKTFAITGWRIGFLAAPLTVMDHLRYVADSMYVCPPAPLQYGVAAGVVALGEDYFRELRLEYSRKKSILERGLTAAGLEPILPQGTYFIIASTKERFPKMTSEQVSDFLIDETRVGSVPASDFLGPDCKGDPAKSNFLRFSFGVADEVLEEAARRLAKL